MSFGDRDTVTYLAGVTDSEGNIGIVKHKRRERLTPAYEPRLQVGNTSNQMLDLFIKTFGGKVTPEKRLTQGGKNFYHWTVYGVPMIKALEAMLPFLIVKREEAKLVIALQQRIWKRSERVGDSKGVSLSELESREKLYEQIQKLTGKTRQLPFDIKDSPPRLF
jgi:hypothetical protein